MSDDGMEPSIVQLSRRSSFDRAAAAVVAGIGRRLQRGAKRVVVAERFQIRVIPGQRAIFGVQGDRTLQLRAERSGGGSGRVYSIHVVCDGDGGTIDDRWIDVRVPHDRGHGHE